jgi:hypothetical protein
MIPDLDTEVSTKEGHPRGSMDLGTGFLLLRAREANPRPLRDCEANALRRFMRTSDDTEFCVRRWAKLRLPTGQTCYSAWKEKERPLERRRTARNIKVS